MKQDTDGGALNVHDSSSVIFLGDLVLEHMEVEGSGGGMYITNDVSRTFPGTCVLEVFLPVFTSSNPPVHWTYPPRNFSKLS